MLESEDNERRASSDTSLTVDIEAEEIPEEEHKAEGGRVRRQQVRLGYETAEHVEGKRL